MKPLTLWLAANFFSRCVYQIQFLSSQHIKVLKEHPWQRLQFEHIRPSAQVPYLEYNFWLSFKVNLKICSHLPNFPPHISPGPFMHWSFPQESFVVPYVQLSSLIWWDWELCLQPLGRGLEWTRLRRLIIVRSAVSFSRRAAMMCGGVLSGEEVGYHLSDCSWRTDHDVGSRPIARVASWWYIDTSCTEVWLSRPGPRDVNPV